jgi:hypothetical protein
MAPPNSPGEVLMNDHGGIYENRGPDSIRTKYKVHDAACCLGSFDAGASPTLEDIAREAKVFKGYVYEVLTEFRVPEFIQNPKLTMVLRAESMMGMTELGPEASLYLLALRAEDDQMPLHEYAKTLYNDLGVSVSCQTVDTFFKNRFDHRGSLQKASPVPLDKFKAHNTERHSQSLDILDKLPDHFKYHFTDEKHVVNSDCRMNQVRADPLPGAIRNIAVTGSFREAYNLLAIISPNPAKQYPAYWICGEENGNVASYVTFLEHLILIGWFERGDILIQDHATIHDQAKAKIAEDLLWGTVVNGQPLHVLTAPLPARAPELNPIELVFHVLAKRLKSYKYRMGRPEDATVSLQAGCVLGELELEVNLKCCAHC